MEAQDKTLVCRDCGGQFIFTAREQEFYREKGYEHLPSRCPDCRARRRGVERQMHTVVCSECGRETTVPFEPRTDRPVYCQSCFAKRRRR